MLNQFHKVFILAHMQGVAMSNQSITGVPFKDFVKNAKQKSDADYAFFLKGIKEMIDCNPEFYKKQLGSSFDFFNNMKVLTVKVVIEEQLSKIFDDIDRAVNNMRSHSTIDDLLKSVFQEKPSGPSGSGHQYNTATQTNTTTAASPRDKHIDEVGACYESFKTLLHGLFADMQPAAFSDPVNERISEVYKKLSDLRNLACKLLPA